MFGRRRKVRLPELPEVRLRDGRLPDVRVPEVRLPDVQLPDVRLRDVPLPEVPELRVPSIALAGLRTPELDVSGRAPFVRPRRSNPIWTGLKFALGLALGLAVGCLVAALLAPAAGEDVRQMLRQRVGGGGPPLADPAWSGSGAITRGTRVPAVANVGAVGELRARFEAAKAAMAQERQAHENALWARFRRSLQTGRVSDV